MLTIQSPNPILPVSGFDRDSSAYLRPQAEVERHSPRVFRQIEVRGSCFRSATESVRCRPRTTRGGEPAVVRTAMTRIPMGPHWPGHSPTQGRKREFPRCVAGSLRVRVGTEGRRPPESDGRIPASSGPGGGQCCIPAIWGSVPSARARCEGRQYRLGGSDVIRLLAGSSRIHN